jgi:hypothetical protein
MLGIARVAAVVGALLAPAVAYVAYAVSQTGVGSLGNGVRSAPAPLAGAGGMGLPVAGGVFWLMRRKRRAI